MMSDLVLETIQIAAALVILACFLAAQAGRLAPHAYRYLVPNLVGSAVLTATAIIGHEWGFVVLEGVWSLFSAYGLSRRLTARRLQVAS